MIFVCVASGPSLTQEQIDTIGIAKGLSSETIKVLGINDNWQWKHQGVFVSDHLYAADEQWWQVWIKEIRASGFPGKKWIPRRHDVADKYALNMIKCDNKPGLSLDPTIVHCGFNSGYQAINLAFHLGATKIVLIGYDMKPKDGKNHWFGDHRHGLRNMPHKLQEWILPHNQLSNDLEQAGIDVVNCTPDSALTQYRTANLHQELNKRLRNQN